MCVLTLYLQYLGVGVVRNSLVYMRRLRGNFTFKFEIMRHIYIYIHITYKRISDFIYFSHERLLTICIVVVGGRRKGFKLILANIWFPSRLLSIPCFNLPPPLPWPTPFLLTTLFRMYICILYIKLETFVKFWGSILLPNHLW